VAGVAVVAGAVVAVVVFPKWSVARVWGPVRPVARAKWPVRPAARLHSCCFPSFYLTLGPDYATAHSRTDLKFRSRVRLMKEQLKRELHAVLSRCG